MFDLEKAIAAWRRPYEHNRAFSAEDLEELEASLRDRVAASVAAGMPEETAYRAALRRMGSHRVADAEYRKVYWGKLRRRRQLLPELTWRCSMLKNYFTIAVRSLLRQKGYAFINLFGLATGLACFLLILLFVQHEWAYDRFHEHGDHLYRIIQQRPGNDYLGVDRSAVTPAALASTLVQAYPEVTAATTFRNREALLSFEDQSHWEEGLWADVHFFNLFTFPLVAGNPETALAAPQSIVLTASLARKLFGDTDPLGQPLRYENEQTYTVTGVMQDPPTHSSLQFAFVADFPAKDITYEYVWQSNNTQTFFMLTPGTDAAQFEAKLPALVDQYAYGAGDTTPPAQRRKYLVQPLADVHLRSQPLNFDLAFTGKITDVYLFLTIAFLILLLACVNYTNLAIARSIKRAREVGLRKVVGARRSQLLGQFLGESVLMAVLALGLALVFVYLLLPIFGHLVERPLQIRDVGDGLLLPSLLGLVIAVGLLSGCYPAFFMASLLPIQVFKADVHPRTRRFRVQHLLIVGQYAVSIVLVASSFLIYQQLQYIQEKDVGYEREHVVTLPVRDRSLSDQYPALRETWLRNPDILAVTTSNDLPSDIRWRQQISGWAGSTEENALPIYRNDVGYDFLEVFGIELVAGRTFAPDRPLDQRSRCLINEATARALGWTPEEAVGQSFRHGNRSREVVGVVQDFHMQSMHLAIQPLLLLLDPERVRHLSLKVRPDNLTATLASLENDLEALTPYPFEYAFLDERFDQLYKAERRLGETFGFFTLLALLIASLGLFGLAAYTATARTKEVGVRKVLGASVAGIVALLSRDFLKWVALAFVLAVPLAYVAMEQWLTQFAYRIDIGPGIFVATGVLVLLIAFLTVSYQALRAARANPVQSLRYE